MNLSVEMLIQCIILLPLLTAVGVMLAQRHPNLREAISLTVASGVFILVYLLYQQTISGQTDTVSWITLLPGLNISFKAEALSVLFALIASFLWIVTTLYAIGYMRSHEEQNQTRFYTFFAVSIFAVMGIALSENLFTLFIFYEVLTLATYPLVTHAGTDKALRGGRTYLRILLGTSIVFFLPALIGTWAIAGNLSFTPGGVFSNDASPLWLAILLVMFVFGIGKAAMMPFHRWLPSAMVAPTPVSALLHAVAVVKAGVFTLIKTLVYIFGLDTIGELITTDFLLYLTAFTILASSLIAMRQDNLKVRLAYSTISQLAYISLGVLLATEAGLIGSSMHIAMHAFGKITLFFCAGAILVASHKTQISQMAGLGRQMPITMMAFFIASLSIIGLPPTGGSWSKYYLLLGALENEYWLLMATLMISSLLNIAYLLPIPIRGFFPGKSAQSTAENTTTSIQEAPLSALIAIIITSLGCVVLFFFPQPVFELAKMVGIAP
ncbi:monovalent cation/H+ antiporter subunit D family protein [Neptunicella sp. SCSIO 80796]|uniref:monovalent cation/H+ antiporter subunit D family protein n=1 Tax=Neptunicella plasticusilytica TaxID=3117012 RepID=UPI003A4DD50A